MDIVAPDALYAFVGHHQGLAGRHHARAVQEALAKVELGEGELEARFHGGALNHKDEGWSKSHLKREKYTKCRRVGVKSGRCDLIYRSLGKTGFHAPPHKINRRCL